jgi:hypothetical protein
MRSFTTAMAAFGLAALVFAPGTSLAFGDGTPDGSPPAEEPVCDEAGLMGSALGLCVAFCEANDCDTHPKAPACEKLRGNYARITGELAFPCELVELPPLL